MAGLAAKCIRTEGRKEGRKEGGGREERCRTITHSAPADLRCAEGEEWKAMVGSARARSLATLSFFWPRALSD